MHLFGFQTIHQSGMGGEDAYEQIRDSDRTADTTVAIRSRSMKLNCIFYITFLILM